MSDSNRKHVVYSNVVDSIPFLEWLPDAICDTKYKLQDILKSKDLLCDFHSWYTYQTNLIRLTSKINSEKLVVFYGNFKDVIAVDSATNTQLGKLIKKLLEGGWNIESISKDDCIDIWIDYGILEDQS